MGDEKFYYTEFFKKIANGQKMLLNEGMSEYGITYVQSLVILRLCYLSQQFGTDYEVTQKDIENQLSLRAPTVTRILSRMEENGCIEKTRSSKDSRAKRIILTEKGQRYYPLFFGVLDQVEAQMTQGMTQEERLQLKGLLERVLKNIENHKK